jgi:hypothetical protein
MIHNHWLSITNHDSQQLVRHSTPWFPTTLLRIIHHDSQPLDFSYHTMIHNHWLRITHHDSQPLAQHNSPWFTTTAQNNTTWFTTAIGCESWCAKLSQWLKVMLCYAEPVVVNHYVLFWVSGCESWCIILSQWLWIMLCYSEQWLWIMVNYAEPVVVNHGVLFWASGCESWCGMTSPVVVLAQHCTPWLTTTGAA